MFLKKEEIKDLRVADVGKTEFKFYYKNEKEYFQVDVNQRSGYKYIINLEDYCITKKEDGFLIKKGYKSYKVIHSIKKSNDYIEVIYYLWGWLPYTRCGGSVSQKCLELIFSGLNKYANQ